MDVRDPGFRKRLLKAIAVAMLVAAAIGPFGYLSEYIGIIGRMRPLQIIQHAALISGMNTVAITFWIVFPILFITTAFKTAADLDMDRRLRLAEELFERARRERAG